MARKLKPFGHGGMSFNNGYDLGLLVSHLEGLVSSETEETFSDKGPRAKRLKKVEDALQLLTDVYECEPE